MLPAGLERAQRGRPPHAETYAEPLPLVVEVWSRSTGGDDVEEVLAVDPFSARDNLVLDHGDVSGGAANLITSGSEKCASRHIA